MMMMGNRNRNRNRRRAIVNPFYIIITTATCMMTTMMMMMTMTAITTRKTSSLLFPSFIRTVSAFTTINRSSCAGTGCRSRSSVSVPVAVAVAGDRLLRNKIHHFNDNGNGGNGYGNGNGNKFHHMQLYSTTSTDASAESSSSLRSGDSNSDDNGENNDNDIKATTGSSASTSNTNKKTNYKKKSTRRSRDRKRRKEESKLGESTKGELSWDSFDFGLNPKQDNRFSNMNNNEIASNSNTEELVFDQEKETIEDIKCSNKLRTVNDAYMKLDPILVSKATSILEPWINEKRQQRITTVLKHRTRNVKFLYENPANPSNVWACLRTIDSFGIQNVDLIIDSGMYGEGKQTLMQKRGMRTAMGSAQWLTLTNYPSTKEAIQHIREVQGYKIYASDLNPNSIDIRDIDWDNNNNMNNDNKNDNDENDQDQNQDQRPICIVMGNEDRGISDEMRLLADETFTLPMYGFAESFNLSVATSIILAHMSSKSVESSTGPLRPGDLNEHEYNCLYLKGLLKSLPKKRLGIALLKKNDIILPADLI